MPIYSLKPVDLSDPAWAASTHLDSCHVHAKSADDARQFASREFFKATSKEFIGQEIRTSPWLDERLVSCQAIADFSDKSVYEEGLVMVPDKGEKPFP